MSNRRSTRRVPGARPQVVKSNQVDVRAAAVSGNLQQVLHALKPRLTRQLVRDVILDHRRDRIDDDVAVVHRVAATDLDVRARPDANAATDSAAANALAETFGENHGSGKGSPLHSGYYARR